MNKKEVGVGALETDYTDVTSKVRLWMEPLTSRKAIL